MENGETMTSGGDKKDVHADIERPKCGWKIWEQRRYLVALMSFLGFFNIYFLRVNLSIAIVAMTEDKLITLKNGTQIHEREFDWNSKQQGTVLSSFFYGYITTQLMGGWMASKLGGKRIYGLGVAVTSALTLVTPFVVKWNFYLFIAVRIVEGIFEGVTYPCIHAIWSRWAPPLERSRLLSVSYSGSYIGTVISMPLCAYLTKAFGWESVFYVSGVCGLIWYACWWYLIAESPGEDARISPEELKYIRKTLGDNNYEGSIEHPWKSMLRSPVVWAIIAAHFSENWGFYTMLTQLPKFMKDILEFDLGKTGFMSAVPYLAMSIIMFVGGYFADWFQVRGILSTTQVRKFFTCAAFLSQTVFMLSAAYLLNPVGTTICLTLAVGLGGFAWAGFGVNYLDIAPNHASVLMGIGNTFGTMPGILSPIITGYLVVTPSGEEWQSVFYIASAIYLCGSIIYGIFANGQVQSWAREKRVIKRKNVENGKCHDNPIYVED